MGASQLALVVGLVVTWSYMPVTEQYNSASVTPQHFPLPALLHPRSYVSTDLPLILMSILPPFFSFFSSVASMHERKHGP